MTENAIREKLKEMAGTYEAVFGIPLMPDAVGYAAMRKQALLEPQTEGHPEHKIPPVRNADTVPVRKSVQVKVPKPENTAPELLAETEPGLNGFELLKGLPDPWNG